MVCKSELVNIILNEKKITDFLKSRNILPVKQSGNKLIYHCPVHEGDNDPSFMVYTNEGSYQTYYCFACNSGINIINLVSSIDKIPLKEAIKKLIEGTKYENYSQTDITNSIIEEILKDEEKKEEEKVEKILIEIGTICRKHLEKYKDDEEVDFFMKVYEKIDYYAQIGNIEILKKMYEELFSNGIPKRIEACQKREEKKFLERFKEWEK